MWKMTPLLWFSFTPCGIVLTFQPGLGKSRIRSWYGIVGGLVLTSWFGRLLNTYISSEQSYSFVRVERVVRYVVGIDSTSPTYMESSTSLEMWSVSAVSVTDYIIMDDCLRPRLIKSLWLGTVTGVSFKVHADERIFERDSNASPSASANWTTST